MFGGEVFLLKKCYLSGSNFCKDHRDKIEVLDPVVVEDLISKNLNNRRK